MSCPIFNELSSILRKTSGLAVIECIKQAELLYQNVGTWISKNRPDLV